MTIVISGRNVNDLYQQGIDLVRRDGLASPSRNGTVLTLPHPVVSITSNPTERVLFDPQRDANPFFHFFECLWMIRGSGDGVWLDRFVKTFSSRFGEPDGRIWGAYGRRWRSWFGFDQLGKVIQMLREDELDRQAVIQMWDASSDLRLVDAKKRDVPCNTQIYLRVLDGALDLTVTVRSNDLIWGAYGANAVHMTFLQEYLAGHLGLKVGKFYQFSNNWHAYTDTLHKVGIPGRLNPYAFDGVKPEPIMTNPGMWDSDMIDFMNDPENFVSTTNLWFMTTAQRAWMAHAEYLNGEFDKAIHWAGGISAQDWSRAMVEWLIRRREAKK